MSCVSEQQICSYVQRNLMELALLPKKILKRLKWHYSEFKKDLNDDYYDEYYEYQFYDEFDDSTCDSTHTAIKVVSNFFCPRIKLNFNEVELSTNHLTVLNKNIRYDINSVIQTEYYFLVCADVYMASSRNLGEEVAALRNKIETLLSLICAIASITSLILTLIVYILLKDLRTPPGLQQMMLSFHLLVAHVPYLFGINAKPNKNLCAAIGLLNNYFWLGSIMWMHICTLHMFRVFYHNIQSTSKRLKQFTRYIFCFSLLITINIVIFFTSDESTDGYSGYGGESCYIKKVTMVLYTFVIPVGVVLLRNIILFSVVIFQLDTALEVQPDTKNNRPMLVMMVAVVFDRDNLVITKSCLPEVSRGNSSCYIDKTFKYHEFKFEATVVYRIANTSKQNDFKYKETVVYHIYNIFKQHDLRFEATVVDVCTTLTNYKTLDSRQN
ncbi:unnamed protein product [Mytilus coruscus]|uniref:G-protein coupled receptors family 2 profile 2 domain-containing protein n=1 Tax=Mytilus coruscus TaxID=42192 RepID=A0A6J8DZE1_MYTCO|nr:unnamed protein product [Mytilus coruscus]